MPLVIYNLGGGDTHKQTNSFWENNLYKPGAGQHMPCLIRVESLSAINSYIHFHTVLATNLTILFLTPICIHKCTSIEIIW